MHRICTKFQMYHFTLSVYKIKKCTHSGPHMCNNCPARSIFIIIVIAYPIYCLSSLLCTITFLLATANCNFYEVFYLYLQNFPFQINSAMYQKFIMFSNPHTSALHHVQIFMQIYHVQQISEIFSPQTFYTQIAQKLETLKL